MTRSLSLATYKNQLKIDRNFKGKAWNYEKTKKGNITATLHDIIVSSSFLNENQKAQGTKTKTRQRALN